MLSDIKILDNHEDVASFVDQVVEAADSDRDALGFFPASVFSEFARKSSLYVAIQEAPGNPVLAGYLLFACHYPKAKVLQVFAKPEFRKAKVAARLVQHLKDELTKTGFISIYARVAEDLVEANEFWGKQDFYVQKIVPGGKTTNRTILIRAHELKSPQLFELSGLNPSNPLELEQFGTTEPPLFLLDLNVLYDLNPNRPRSDSAISLFRAERMGICRLAISSEIDLELKRTALGGRPDPMMSFAGIFPVFQFQHNRDQGLLKTIGDVVFPTKDHKDLSANELSDLRHVATAIQHRLTGLITNDQAILNATGEINRQYGVQICSPTVFNQITSEALEDDAITLASSETLELRQVKNEDVQTVQDLLSKIGVAPTEISAGWGAMVLPQGVTTRLGVWESGNLHGYLVCQARVAESIVTAKVAVDEIQMQGKKSARLLLAVLIDHASDIGAKKIALNISDKQESVRDQATKLGFSWSIKENSLNKLIINNVVTPSNWHEVREEILSFGGVKLPQTAPLYKDINQQIEIQTPAGNKSFITLKTLELLLSPILFCLSGRPALITPVAREFSEPLLGHSTQKNLLPQLEVYLHKERHYLSSKRNLKLFQKGALIFFYESQRNKGRAAVVAVARVKHAYLRTQTDLLPSDYEPSVLSERSIERIGKSLVKTITVFDNLLVLPKPVPLQTLRDIGCGKATDLLTTRSISGSQLATILSEGFNCAE